MHRIKFDTVSNAFWLNLVRLIQQVSLIGITLNIQIKYMLIYNLNNKYRALTLEKVSNKK